MLPSSPRYFTPSRLRRQVFPLPAPGNEKPRKGKKDYSGLEYKCLVRATDGKRKLSATLNGKELVKFQASYGTILKVSLWGGGEMLLLTSQGLGLSVAMRK
jgi:hypothetical protein